MQKTDMTFFMTDNAGNVNANKSTVVVTLGDANVDSPVGDAFSFVVVKPDTKEAVGFTIGRTDASYLASIMSAVINSTSA
jgi:hypothetical protein